jgi:hypothetical protein
MKVRAIIIAVILLMTGPASALGNWGLEVGRANGGDVVRLQKDWLTFQQMRAQLREMATREVQSDRQKQLLGTAEDGTLGQLYEKLEDFWLNNLLDPLERIALNPAASCAEAQFALMSMIGMRRQQQLIGIEESEILNRVYEAIEKAAFIRCRDEALDECVATGRFKQIIDLMVNSDRQMQLLGGTGDDEAWAEDALKQCAIYELHFVSRTKTKVTVSGTISVPVTGPGETETVRDGKIQIRFEIPSGGLKAAKGSLRAFLKGKTAGSNNPSLVSVKCKSPVKQVEWICSPQGEISPVRVWINDFDLRHREFYLENVKDENTLKETDVSRERVVGEDKFSFEFEGGEFNLQALFKLKQYTSQVPMPDYEGNFYTAHNKDLIGIGSPRLKIENTRRGVHPIVFQFTYADEYPHSPVLISDSTEFQFIHKPEPKPFQKPPEPIRKPLKPPTGE